MNRIVIPAVVLALAGAAAGQQGVLYITSGNGGGSNIVSVQNGAIINVVDVGAYTGGQGPGGIAVYDDVRVVGQFGAGGVQTDLNLVVTGPTFGGLPFGDSYDGTSDGKYNYITDYANADIYRTDRDYSNATLLFNNGGNDTIGITYNPYNGHIYTHGQGSGIIYEHDTNGNPIGQIQTSFGGENWRGLAFDPSDSTFWLTEHSPNTGNIRQVDLSGNTLQTLNIPGLTNYSPNAGPLGAEFNLGKIPAPGAAALLGVGGLVAARRRRA